MKSSGEDGYGYPYFIEDLPVPNHIKKHAGGSEVAARRCYVWETAIAAWNRGDRPVWCGQREDGAVLVIWPHLSIRGSQKEYWGIGIIFNGCKTTVLYDLSSKTNQDGSPRRGDLMLFDQIPLRCLPDPHQLFTY